MGFWSFVGKVAVTTTAGALLGAGEVAGLGSGAGSSVARSATKEFFVIDGVKIFANAERARAIATAIHGAKVGGDVEFWISKGVEAKDLLKHKIH